MLTIPNVQTLDGYDPALTLGPIATTRGIKYVVANQAVLAQVAPISKSGTLEDWGDEVLITPETNSISAAAGIRFKSAVPGSPARVVAQLYLPADPQFGSGTPFTGSLSASGAVTPTGTVGVDGWVSVGTILTYASTDGHTFVFGTSADLSAVISLGARLKFTQGGNVFYFLVTGITGATITLYGGTSYAPVNAAVTAVSYSVAKAPFGFPLGPDLWSELLTDTSQRFQVAPVSGTWYNLGGLSLVVPIGYWRLSYNALLRSLHTSSGVGTVDWKTQATLSATSSTESDAGFTAGLDYWEYAAVGPGAAAGFGAQLTREAILGLVAKRQYFLNVRWTNNANATANEIDLQGTESPTIIRATSAYL